MGSGVFFLTIEPGGVRFIKGVLKHCRNYSFPFYAFTRRR